MTPIHLLVGFFGLLPLPTDFQIKIESNTQSQRIVAPGASLDYQITGELSDTNHQGLAMFSFDLIYSGGVLAQANAAAGSPMSHFYLPLGLSNPGGFGGTPSGGMLLQLGGAQNTLNNVFAPFPSGPVLLNVATNSQPELFFTGTLSAPMTPGVYTLQASSAFANVLRTEQTGQGFWQVDAANIAAPAALTIDVRPQALRPCAVSGVGSRYLSISAPTGARSIALSVESSAHPCLVKYVQPDGSLGETPIFQLGSRWGTLSVGDGDLLPQTQYKVRAISAEAISPYTNASTWKWGDGNHNGFVNLDDILCVLNGFSGNFPICSLESVDLTGMGNAPDGTVNLMDILAVLNAFSGSGAPTSVSCE